jgi:NTP pyrophosphatase (non-canonical NTP hydrolase)
MNQLDIDLQKTVLERFPYKCSYCGECPCVCKAKKVQKRSAIIRSKHGVPKTLGEMQKMFNDVYPAKTRTLEHAGIHLAEEVGELAEAVLQFRGHHTNKDFEQLKLEAADLYSCFMGVFNSLGVDYHKELVSMFFDGCHACKKTPCACEYDFVVKYRS